VPKGLRDDKQFINGKNWLASPICAWVPSSANIFFKKRERKERENSCPDVFQCKPHRRHFLPGFHPSKIELYQETLA